MSFLLFCTPVSHSGQEHKDYQATGWSEYPCSREQQGEGKQTGLCDKSESKKKAGPVTKRWISEKTEGRNERCETDHDNRARRPVLRWISSALRHKNREKKRFEAEENSKRDVRLRCFEKLEGPAVFDEDRAGRREQDEIIPTLAQGDSGDADIEDCNVAEKRSRIVDACRK